MSAKLRFMTSNIYIPYFRKRLKNIKITKKLFCRANLRILTKINLKNQNCRDEF